MIQTVEETYFDSLFDFQVFQKILNENLPVQLTEINSKFSDEESKLEILNDQDAMVQNRLLMQNRHQALIQLAREWFLSQISKHHQIDEPGPSFKRRKV